MAAVALPMLSARAPDRPRQLPASITRSKVAAPSPRAKSSKSMQSVYQWNSVQKIRHEDHVNKRGGVFVTTLCMDFQGACFAGGTPRMVRIEKENYVPVHGGAVWCYLIGGICVVLKGIVAGKRDPGDSSSAVHDLVIARLPEGLRPARPLVFAALALDSFDDGAKEIVNSSLVTLLVTPNGEIIKTAGGTSQSIIDLSAIRFCTDRGISLVDEVSVHAVDVNGTRLVTLQGLLLERHWGQVGSKKQLTNLPESCRPAKDIFFIVPGLSREGFHLVHVRSVATAGAGGEIMWRDSIWRRDRINLTGVFFEVAREAIAHLMQGTEQEREVTKQALTRDFSRRLNSKYGSIENGLHTAFGLHTLDAEMNFTQFVGGIKKLGYYGTMMRLWSIFDEDASGQVSFEEVQQCLLSVNEATSAPLPQTPALPTLTNTSKSRSGYPALMSENSDDM